MQVQITFVKLNPKISYYILYEIIKNIFCQCFLHNYGVFRNKMHNLLQKVSRRDFPLLFPKPLNTPNRHRCSRYCCQINNQFGVCRGVTLKSIGVTFYNHASCRFPALRSQISPENKKDKLFACLFIPEKERFELSRRLPDLHP